MDTDADVIVIGAGLAGLTAARDLREADHRVIVLEARDRLGGRTWTGRLQGTDVPVEWGGTWVHPHTQPAVAREIERYGLTLTPTPDPTDLVAVVGDRVVRGADAERLLDDIVVTLDTRLDPLRARIGADPDPVAVADLDVAVTTWIAANGIDGAAADALLAFAAAMGGGEPDRQGILPLVLDAIQMGYPLEPRWRDAGSRFDDGTIALVEALADGLDVRRRRVVRVIRDAGVGVSVECEGGASFRADVAVVALPLNVWRHVRFEPGLGEAKARAASIGHPGHSSKVFAVARHVSAGLGAIGWGVPLQALLALEAVGTDSRLVVGFAGHGRVDGDDPDVVRAAVRAFVPEADIVAHGWHDWSADPYALGTWFAMPPGWTTDGTFTALERPEGRLVFAGGDVAIDGAGWIEGAVASGGRAATTARRLLDRSPARA